MEGPQNIGGRLNVIKQDPFDTNHILAGSSAGGLFGTSDGGINWSPLYLKQLGPTHSTTYAAAARQIFRNFTCVERY